MKVKDLIKQLEKLKKKHGNIEVLILSDSSGPDDIPFDIGSIDFCEVETNKYELVYNMPLGFQYIKLYGP